MPCSVCVCVFGCVWVGGGYCVCGRVALQYVCAVYSTCDVHAVCMQCACSVLTVCMQGGACSRPTCTSSERSIIARATLGSEGPMRLCEAQTAVRRGSSRSSSGSAVSWLGLG